MKSGYQFIKPNHRFLALMRAISFGGMGNISQAFSLEVISNDQQLFMYQGDLKHIFAYFFLL